MIGITEILGGITGLIGGITTAITNYKLKKLEIEDKKNERLYKLEKMDKDLQIIKVENEAKLEITRETYRGEESKLDAQAYVEGTKKIFGYSFDLNEMIDKLNNFKGWLKIPASLLALIIVILTTMIESLRMLMRPGLTLYHVSLSSYFTFRVFQYMNEHDIVLTSVDCRELLIRILDVVIYMTCSMALWWFSDRSTTKFLQSIYKRK